MSPGQLMSGGVVSTTLTLNEQLLFEFPHASVAVQVSAVVPIGKVSPDAWRQLTLVVEQVSPATAENAMVFPAGESHSCVMSAGQDENAGGVVSTMAIVCVALAELRQASVAVQV